MAIASDTSNTTQQNNTALGTTPRTQVTTPNPLAGLRIPSPVIAAAVGLFKAGVSPEAVVNELTKVLSKTYDPATAKALAEKAVFDALKSPEGTKALFDSKIANQKNQQEIKNFIDSFVQRYGDDPALMNQLNTYVKNLSFDNYVKMGVADSGQSAQAAAGNITDFLVDSLDGAPDGGIDPEEARSLADQKTTHLAMKNSAKEFSEISGLVMNARVKNPDNLNAAKQELMQSLISRGYSPEDAKILSDRLMSNYVRGDNNVISDDVALIVYSHISGSTVENVPAELQNSIKSANAFTGQLRSFMHLTEGWSKDSMELKQQLDQETIDSIPGALSFGMNVAIDTQYELDSITAPSADGGPSKLDQAYADGVDFWVGVLEDGTASEADIKEILVNDYKLSPKDADAFIDFITSGDTTVVPDSIKQIMNNDGSGGVALFSDIGMYNNQADVLTEKLDSFEQSLKSELEAIGVSPEILDKYTAVQLTDSKVQAEIAEQSGVDLNSIAATVNSAEVTLRLYVGTTEQESGIAALEQKSFENLIQFNSGVISKEEYDSRASELTTLKNEAIQIAQNMQANLKRMLELFLQILAMHP